MTDNPCTRRSRHLRLKPVAARQSTDKFFIVFFAINLCLWLQIGIHEVWTDSTHELDGFSLFKIDFKWNFTEFIVYGTSAAFVAILSLYVLSRMNAEWMIFVITFFIFSIIVGLIILILWHIVTFTDSRLNYLLLTFTITVACLIYYVTNLICIMDGDTKLLAQMIKEPFQAIFNSLLALLLFFVVSFWLTMVLIVTVTIIVIVIPTMGHPIEEYTTERCFLWLRICVYAFTGSYMLNFTWNFGFIIMADYSANYYGTADNEQVSMTYIFQSITRVVRYHLGTVAFLSTPILPCICAAILSIKNYVKFGEQPGYKVINFVSKICLITDIVDYTLIQTSYYGSNSFKSMRKMLYLHRSNSLIFLSLNTVFIRATEISILIALTVGMIIQRKYESHITIDHINQLLMDVILAVTYVNLIHKFFTRPAMCTFVVYKMIGLRKSRTW